MKRTMLIHYPHDKALADKLHTCLDMCCIPHVIYDDLFRYTIYIDKGTCTWQQVMQEVNRVKSTKFRYAPANERIEKINGKYTVIVNCGTIHC